MIVEYGRGKIHLTVLDLLQNKRLVFTYISGLKWTSIVNVWGQRCNEYSCSMFYTTKSRAHLLNLVMSSIFSPC